MPNSQLFLCVLCVSVVNISTIQANDMQYYSTVDELDAWYRKTGRMPILRLMGWMLGTKRQAEYEYTVKNFYKKILL